MSITPGEIEVSLFIDETGDIQNASDGKHYGLGFCFAPTSNLISIEQLLIENHLMEIHLKELPHPQKIEVANKLASLNLQDLDLRGGAVLQGAPDFSKKFAINYISKVINKDPIMLMSIMKHLSQRQIVSKIILLEDIFPNVFDNTKMMEFLLHTVRMPVLRVLHKFGHFEKVHIKIYLSSVSDMDSYIDRIVFSQPNMRELLFEFLQKLYEEKHFARNPSDFVSVQHFVVESSRGFFGLADIFGGVGHHLLREQADPNHSIGSSLYIILNELFPQGPSHGWEMKRGIFLVGGSF